MADKVACCYGKGFHLELNGITVSVQFGYGNYGSNRYEEKSSWPMNKEPVALEATEVEVAVFRDNTDEWLTQQIWKEWLGVEIGDDVVGYIEPRTVAELIAWLQTQPQYWKKEE